MLLALFFASLVWNRPATDLTRREILSQASDEPSLSSALGEDTVNSRRGLVVGSKTIWYKVTCASDLT